MASLVPWNLGQAAKTTELFGNFPQGGMHRRLSVVCNVVYTTSGTRALGYKCRCHVCACHWAGGVCRNQVDSTATRDGDGDGDDWSWMDKRVSEGVACARRGLVGWWAAACPFFPGSLAAWQPVHYLWAVNVDGSRGLATKTGEA